MSEILNQTWSISIFNFLVIVLLVAVLSSVLTYIPLIKRLMSADIDTLTGCKNERVLKPILKKEIRKVTAEKSLSIILIDIDNFKKINGTYGQTKTDLLLVELIELLKRDSRMSTDILIRCHRRGDEFLIIATGTKGIGARVYAERLRKLIQNAQFQIGTTFESITVSIGVAELNNENETPEDFLIRVDEALKVAKKGKNCTFLFT